MQPAAHQSQLFTLRLWKERQTGEGARVRIKVKHVLSGDVRYFREWSTLIDYLLFVVEKEVDDTQNHID